uniref:C2H2-type domain-containing protein n=2 Tax=Strongyloides stercoralis TaxID=6248 RepID=A0AAF5CZ06_STRER
LLSGILVMFTSSPPLNPSSFNLNNFFKSVSQSTMSSGSPSGSPSNSQISPINQQSPQDQNNTNQFMAALASLSNINNSQNNVNIKDMNMNPLMNGFNVGLNQSPNPIMLNNPTFFAQLLQNSMGNPMAINFFQQMLMNNNNSNNENKTHGVKRSFDSISKSPSSPPQNVELLNYMKEITFTKPNGMIQCNICHQEYGNIKDLYKHILEEKSKMNNMYKSFSSTKQIIGNVIEHNSHSPIDLQQESRFKRYENSIDNIKQNQKNRYKQRDILKAQPLVTRSPSTTISSPYHNERISEGGCSDSPSRSSISSTGDVSNKSHDENSIKKFKITDNCCRKCNKVTEYLCINMTLRHPLCKECFDNFNKNKINETKKNIKENEGECENYDIGISSEITEHGNEFVLIGNKVQ